MVGDSMKEYIDRRSTISSLI